MAHKSERVVQFTDEDHYSEALNHAWDADLFVKRGDLKMTLLGDSKTVDRVCDEINEMRQKRQPPELFEA